MKESRDDSPLLSVVVPVFNEAEHLAITISGFKAELDRLGISYELLMVDDGSLDKSWQIINEIAAAFPCLRGLRFSRNFGKEAALAAGLDAARGQAVLTMDGDMQHPPALIAEMVAIWQRGEADVVEAVKTSRGKEPFWQKLGAHIFSRAMTWITGRESTGATDFKLMDRAIVDAWRQMGEYNLFFRGMAGWLGFRRRTLTFEVPARASGKSRWRVGQLIRLAINGITSFTSLPLHLTTLIGGCFLIFSLLLGAQTLYIKLSGQAVSGFATVILLLLLIGSCILISLGVVGIYIARIYEEVKRRPRYLINGRCGEGQLEPRRENHG